MFIHWGLYAIEGRGEWIMYQEHIPPAEYAKLADQFDAKNYDPTDWVRIAQDAGMKYMVLTTRHHDGFCLYDSDYSDFTAPKTAAKRDLIAEFVEACHQASMPIGFYYSLLDWRFDDVIPQQIIGPDSVYESAVEQAHAQMRELCTNYGEIDIIWYDGMHPGGTDLWRSHELNAMVRELQPSALINNRAGLPEDFGTPENVIRPEDKSWEACFTMNDSWGYAVGDTNYKSSAQLLRLLGSCAAQNGNFLLNVGPKPDGSFPDESLDRLSAIGKWMRTNGEAIYGAGSTDVVAPAMGWSTSIGDSVYLLVQRWPGTTLPFAWCGSRVSDATVLATGQEARIEQDGDRVWLHELPESAPDPDLSVIRLKFDGTPKGSDPPYR